MRFRRKRSDNITGFLDKGTNVTGELEFAGTIRIDGNFHGSISTRDVLIIGEHAVVHGDILVGEIEIYGKVFGNIESKRRVEIFPSGRVQGDVKTPVLVMIAGAALDGRTHMATERPDETTVAARSSLRSEETRQERF